jgi:RHS repeat-associated protein
VLAQENANGELLWALTDNQGSVRMLLDNNGDVVNNITYDAFGNITLETNSNVNFRFSYTGRELDAETGLYNYRTRYLDPKTGQFINEDTIGFAGGDSNLYRYVANSPVNYIDPDGETLVLAVGGVILVGAAALLYLEVNRQYQEMIDSLPPEAFDPNWGIRNPVDAWKEYLDNDSSVEQFIPPQVESGTQPLDRQQEVDRDHHTGKSCDVNYPDFSPPPYFESSNDSFGNADPNISIEKQLQGKGQLKDLRSNKNLKDVDINDLLRKTPDELIEMQKRGEINRKTLKQIQKAFEGRDLGKRGKNKQ